MPLPSKHQQLFDECVKLIENEEETEGSIRKLEGLLCPLAGKKLPCIEINRINIALPTFALVCHKSRFFGVLTRELPKHICKHSFKQSGSCMLFPLMTPLMFTVMADSPSRTTTVLTNPEFRADPDHEKDIRYALDLCNDRDQSNPRIAKVKELLEDALVR